MMLWALHGFLGKPSDFDPLRDFCLRRNNNIQWQSLDYLHLRELSPQNSLGDWGGLLNRYVSRHSGVSSENILLGYSQGGRLALHALKDNPKLWKAAVIISSNPGIHAWEKSSRLQSDEEWAERFLNKDFKKTVQKWNSLPVFAGSREEPVRLEQDYNRRQLADCLLNWSVAKQEDFRPYLETFLGNLFYVCGENDPKYCQTGKDLEQKNKKIHLVQVKNSGHRVLFDQPEALGEVILRALSS